MSPLCLGSPSQKTRHTPNGTSHHTVCWWVTVRVLSRVCQCQAANWTQTRLSPGYRKVCEWPVVEFLILWVCGRLKSHGLFVSFCFGKSRLGKVPKKSLGLTTSEWESTDFAEVHVATQDLKHQTLESPLTIYLTTVAAACRSIFGPVANHLKQFSSARTAASLEGGRNHCDFDDKREPEQHDPGPLVVDLAVWAIGLPPCARELRVHKTDLDTLHSYITPHVPVRDQVRSTGFPISGRLVRGE